MRQTHELVKLIWLTGLKRFSIGYRNHKEYSMRLLAITLVFLSTFAYGQYGQSLNPNDSPLNPLNSELNPNNSSLNPRNSPLNPNNSPLNPNSTNGVYDNSGNRVGYEVKAPSGVVNYFDNSGNRTGYSPAKK